MTHPIRLERDTFIVSWIADLAGWCTTAIGPGSDSWAVRSSGNVGTDWAVESIIQNTGVVAANTGFAVGVHIEGPEETLGVDDNQFSLYAVQAVAYCEDENLRPMLFIGESPASVTNSAAGNTVTDVRIIGVPDGSGTQGGCLSVEMVLAVKENTADRNLCFGVAVMAGLTGSSNANCLMNMCVRRLLGSRPAILDATKL